MSQLNFNSSVNNTVPLRASVQKCLEERLAGLTRYELLRMQTIPIGCINLPATYGYSLL
jgi:hypothetical protein